MANATPSACAEYHPDSDIQELFSDIGVSALFKAWNTKSPSNGELVRSLHQAIPGFCRNNPPAISITVRHKQERIALIAFDSDQRFTPVPTDMIQATLHPPDGDPAPGLNAIQNFVEAES